MPTARDMCREGRQQPLMRAGNDIAKNWYEQAKSAEMEYMPAYAEYSYVFVREYQNAWGSDRATSLAKALELADEAVNLAGQSGNSFYQDFRARWYRAIVYWNQGDFPKSFQEYELARGLISKERYEIDTADLDADLAEAYIYFGDPQKAIKLIIDATKLHPEPPYWYKWNLARAYYMAGQYQAAIDTVNEIKNPPNDVRLILAASMARRAEEVMQAFMNEDPDWTVQKSEEYHYGNNTQKQHWLTGLRKAGLREK